MDRTEGREQVRALEELANLYDRDHRFTAIEVCRIHELWLGQIYPGLSAHGEAIQRRDPEDFTDPREDLMRRDVLASETKSDGLSLTPSTSVEVYTVISNISRRFAGSRR